MEGFGAFCPCRAGVLRKKFKQFLRFSDKSDMKNPCGEIAARIFYDKKQAFYSANNEMMFSMTLLAFSMLSRGTYSIFP